MKKVINSHVIDGSLYVICEDGAFYQFNIQSEIKSGWISMPPIPCTLEYIIKHENTQGGLLK